MTAPVAVIRELHCVAAFYSKGYIITKVEKTKANLRFALIEEHFYGNLRSALREHVKCCLKEKVHSPHYITLSKAILIKSVF
jgi:hypothetical protein